MPDEHRQRISRQREDAANPSSESRREEEILFAFDRDLAEANAFRRQQRLLDAQSRGRVLFANVLPWAALVIVGVVIAIMLFHYLAPTAWAWLNESQIDKLETAIASSATSALLIYARHLFLR